MAPLLFLLRKIPPSDRNTSRFCASRLVHLSEARGVGNISRDDKSSLALMPRADAASRKYEWENSVSRFCQVKNRFVEPHIDEASNIFPKHPSGPQFGNNPAHFRPQVAFIRKALPFSGGGEGLTGKSAGNDGNCLKSCSFKKRLLCKSSNIPEFRYIRPAIFQYGIREIRPLALADGLETCRLRRQVQTANAGKQAHMSQCFCFSRKIPPCFQILKCVRNRPDIAAFPLKRRGGRSAVLPYRVPAGSEYSRSHGAQ